MSSEGFHESQDLLSPETRDLHRAVVSLGEELAAIDWYQQRADACGDDALRAVLLHNQREEIEHAMMLLEWIRRVSPEFDGNIRKYLLTVGPITSVEQAGKMAGGETTPPVETKTPREGSLGIGSLRPPLGASRADTNATHEED